MCVHVFLRGETHTNAHLKMLTIIVSASLSWIKIGVVFQYLPVLKIPLEFHTDNTHIHIYIQAHRILVPILSWIYVLHLLSTRNTYQLYIV